MRLHAGILVCSLAACRAGTPEARPNPYGVNTPVAAAADSLLTRYAMYGLSGSVLLEREGRVILEKGYGLANRERGLPATKNTRYDIGSIAKTFTAAAIVQLAAEGKLKLTDSLSRFFPNASPDKARVTIHHLLTHTGGFGLDPSDAGITSTENRDQFITKAVRAPIDSARFGSYSYSNLGYGLLAVVVEQVSGMEFREYVDRRLISRAGLAATTWHRTDTAMAVSGAATGYEFSDRELDLAPEFTFGRGGPDSPMWNKWPLGAGGMVSTVGDLRRWWHALHDGIVVPASAAKTMLSRRDTTGNQGYSWTINDRGGETYRVYKGGSRTGFNSLIAWYPNRGSLLVYAINQSTESQWHGLVWRNLERLLLGEAPDPLPPSVMTLPSDRLQRFAGTFQLGDGGEINVVAEGGELLVGAENQAGVDALLGMTVANAAQYSERSREIIQELVARRTTDTAALSRAYATEVANWLSSRVDAADVIRVLGTAPHASGQGRVQTFVRIGGNRSSVVRLVWSGNRVAAWGSGVRFPTFARYRPTSDSSAASFNARERGWSVLRLHSDGVLEVIRRDGGSTGFARRLQR